ncbi:hypothetical protein [Flavobacterium sp.]|jgi:hypothetical protein|uniref:hypothetical protein n=1 Tax=Flavobacterium sp. TaxID=239 RepID=UPI0022C4607D|nr:hypothetical protein [Flavobacterium sp.]MCZ8091313.1 hypothetical protein [Flavobacterium sp.]
MTLQEASELDFNNLTEEDLEKIENATSPTNLHDLFSIFRGIERHFIIVQPFWKNDYEKWTDEDKRFAKEILKFSLSYSGFQDVKS